MEFLVQVSNPIIWDQTGVEVENLSQAIRKVFEEYTETIFLSWNGIPVSMTYEHDLAVNLGSILVLLENMLSSREGSYILNWGTDTMNAEWHTEWENNDVKIKSKWNTVLLRCKDLLNDRNYLKFSIDLFLREWKMLLRTIIDAINQSGIVISNKDEFNTLCKIESEIDALGYLYVIDNGEISLDDENI
jgi:hypothetical protein